MVGGQRHAPVALPPVKTRDPLYRRLGGPQGRFGQLRKIAPRPGIDPRTVRAVASRYTDWAILTHVGIEGSVCVTELEEGSSLRAPCGCVTAGANGSVFQHKLVSGLKNKTACEKGHL